MGRPLQDYEVFEFEGKMRLREFHRPEVVRCRLCDACWTESTGTRLCDPCWELETRVQASPELARKVLKELEE